MARKSYKKHNKRKGSGRKNHKNNKKEKKNDFDKSIVTGISRTIRGFKDLRELNNFEKLNKPHFADENGFAYIIAYQFSSYGEPIKTNQLRKFFGDIKAIEREGSWEKAELGFNLLKPKFAISVSRKSNDKPLVHIEFYKLIKATMDKVKVVDNPEISFENLKTFSRFFEAIVAYHKLHEENYELNEKIRKLNREQNKQKKNKDKSRRPKAPKINLDDIFNETIIKLYPSGFDYDSFKEICSEIDGFSSLQELENVSEKFNKPSFEGMDGYADIIAKQFSKVKDKRINSNQIRRFYNEIKNIERKGNWEDAKTDFYLLKPRLAISVARKSSGSSLIPYEFYYFIKLTMNKVYIKDNPDLSFKNLQLFARFFEAIVGFHKFYTL